MAFPRHVPVVIAVLRSAITLDVGVTPHGAGPAARGADEPSKEQKVHDLLDVRDLVWVLGRDGLS